MRLGSSNVQSERDEIQHFADWILCIGDGDPNADEFGESSIEFPPDLLITDETNPLQSLIDFTYPDFMTNMNNQHFF